MGGEPMSGGSGYDVIQRSRYSLAGQTIAIRVSGDPVSGNNGLFYYLTDHLGSTSALMTSSNGIRSGSMTRYHPFGSYRGNAPAQQLTDQGFTGHKQNDDLGLIYMNARYYVGSIGRFASADTIVPDPMNPQQFNRYTYVLNNPLRFTDPTGHYCYDPSSGADLLGTCIHDDGITYHLARDPIQLVEWELQLLTMIIINEIAGQPLEQIEYAAWTVLNRYAIADLRTLPGFKSRMESILIGSPIQYHAAFGYQGGTYRGGVFSGSLAGTGPLGPEAAGATYTGWLRSQPYATQDSIDMVSNVIKAYNSGAADPTGGADSFYHKDSIVMGGLGGAYWAEQERLAALVDNSPQAAAATGWVEGNGYALPRGWSKDMVYWKQWGR
jgi:RHS repeat-associated protein